MVLNAILDPIFSPLLSLPPFWGILVISLIVTIIITLIYKLVTDQEVMKTLKADMKHFQKEMKKFKDDPKKMMKLQKKAMEKNMQYMGHSMKPTLFTLIPILLIFGWLSSHFAYYPLSSDEEFELTAFFDEGVGGSATLEVPSQITIVTTPQQQILNEKATWVLIGEEGDYNVNVRYEGEVFEKRVVISDEFGEYAEVETSYSGDLDMITLSNEKVRPLNLFGWRIGWLGTYIIFSIVFSTLLRKLLKLH